MRLYIAIPGAVLTYYFSLENGWRSTQDVFHRFSLASALSGSMLLYVFCMLPFAMVFCEDMEHRYVRYQIIRGNLIEYVVSKVTVIYISSVLVYVFSSMLFVASCRIQLPWVVPGHSYLSFRFGELIENGYYWLYYLVTALQRGFLAGALSVMTAFLSLFSINKLMAMALPVCLLQVINELAGIKQVTLFWFIGLSRITPHDWIDFLYAFCISVLISGLAGAGIIRKLK